MLLSCKLKSCVVPHMPGRRMKRDGNLNYWLSVFRTCNSFSSFWEDFLFSFFFNICPAPSFHRNTVAWVKREWKTTYIRSSKLQQWAAQLGSSSWTSSSVLQTALPRIAECPCQALSRHRGQKSISNKLHFPELLRRRRQKIIPVTPLENLKRLLLWKLLQQSRCGKGEQQRDARCTE